MVQSVENIARRKKDIDDEMSLYDLSKVLVEYPEKRRHESERDSGIGEEGWSMSDTGWKDFERGECVGIARVKGVSLGSLKNIRHPELVVPFYCQCNVSRTQ